MTSLELRKLIVKLRNEDKLSVGDISKIAVHSILRKLEETGSCGAKNLLARPGKLLQTEERWIGNESRKDRLATATVIAKRANGNIDIKISRHTISWILDEYIWTVE